jgi:hypothetical protein
LRPGVWAIRDQLSDRYVRAREIVDAGFALGRPDGFRYASLRGATQPTTTPMRRYSTNNRADRLGG